MNKKRWIKEWLLISVAMVIISVAVYFFLLPSEIIVGSISGLAMVLAKLFPMTISSLTFLMNVVLLVIGFLLVGKEFGIKTVYTSLLLPFFIFLFETLFPLKGSLTGSQIYDLITYILLLALGQAVLFNVNASSGGLDIVAKIIHKYWNMDIGQACSVAGMISAATSILAYDIGTLIVSLLATYANGQAVDYFIDGFHRKKRICILCEEYETIQDYIMNTMKRGVTLYVAQGGYDKQVKMELVTIMDKQEYKQLLNYLHNENFKAFVSVSTVNEVIGTWNEEKS